MDEKELSPSVLASVSDAAGASFVPIVGQKRRRRVFVISVKLLVSALIVTWLVHTQRLGIMRIRDAWHSPVQLWGALALLLLLPFVLTLRWQVLLRALEYRLPYRNMLSMTFMVVFFDTIMPGGAADVIRGYYLDRSFRLQYRARALTTVVVDRFLGVMGLVLAALGALVLKSHTALGGTALRSLELISAAVGVVFLFVFLFLLSRRNIGRTLLDWICSRIRLLKPLLKVYDAFRSYGEKTGPMLQALGLSMAGNGLTITSILLLGSVAGESHLRAVDYFCLVPLGLFVAQLPISPGGIGVGHLGFYSLFKMAGSGLGAEIFSLFILVRFVSSLPGLFSFLRTRQQIKNRVRGPKDMVAAPDGRRRWASIAAE
jgi:glycosyltransferase 2 family protein